MWGGFEGIGGQKYMIKYNEWKMFLSFENVTKYILFIFIPSALASPQPSSHLCTHPTLCSWYLYKYKTHGVQFVLADDSWSIQHHTVSLDDIPTIKAQAFTW